MQIRYIISLLRSLAVKDNIGAELICTILKLLISSQTSGKQQRTALGLIEGIIDPLEMNIEVDFSKEKEIYEKDVNKELYKIFFEKSSKTVDFLLLQEKIETFWSLQDYLSLHSADSNFLAAMGQTILSSLEDSIAFKRLFIQQMILLCAGTSNGPFVDYNFNTLCLAQEYVPSLFERLPVKHTPDYKHKKAHVIDRALAVAWVSVTNPQVLMSDAKQIDVYTTRKGEILTRKDISSLYHNLKDTKLDYKISRNIEEGINAILYLGCELVRKRAKHRLGSKFKSFLSGADQTRVVPPQNIRLAWKSLLADTTFYDLAIDLFCSGLHLNPRVHWQETLRMGFLPNLDQRFTMYSQQLEEQIESSFEKRLFGEKEIYYAAWLLIFDGWLNIYGYYTSPNGSLFNHIADLTRDINMAPLRVAHCIRDLCYNDVSRTKDLVEMINSQDPKYRIIFEECLWYSKSDEIILEVEDQTYVQLSLLPFDP
jgi:hypothetical protein